MGATPARDGWTIGAATGLVGVAFGVLAAAEGLGPAKALAMSLLVFTGASQFAAVGIVSAGGSIGAALGAALLLAARNGLYGPVVARWFGDEPLTRRAALAHLIIDESTGLGAAQSDLPASRTGFLAGGIAVFVCWNVGTIIGALGGNLIGDITAWGLDAAFPAVFVALLAPHLRTRPGRVVSLCATALCIVAIPVLPVGVPILVAALGVVPAGWVRR